MPHLPGMTPPDYVRIDPVDEWKMKDVENAEWVVRYLIVTPCAIAAGVFVSWLLANWFL